MALHPGQHLVDLADLPAALREAPVREERIGLVEDQEGASIARLGEGPGDDPSQSGPPTWTSDRTPASARPPGRAFQRGSERRRSSRFPADLAGRARTAGAPARSEAVRKQPSGSVSARMSAGSNPAGAFWGGLSQERRRARLRTPVRTAAMSPPARLAAAVAPAAIPGAAASNSEARVVTSSGAAAMS